MAADQMGIHPADEGDVFHVLCARQDHVEQPRRTEVGRAAALLEEKLRQHKRQSAHGDIDGHAGHQLIALLRDADIRLQQGQGDAACFLFGSELSALKAHPAFAAGINLDALCLLMRHNYIPAPHSIYQGIHKLPPGHLLAVSLARREPVLDQYWSLPAVAEAGVARPFVGTDVQAVDELEALLKHAVCQQMVADVPLGAFLSGGIDSSTVVALMQSQASRPV